MYLLDCGLVVFITGKVHAGDDGQGGGLALNARVDDAYIGLPVEVAQYLEQQPDCFALMQRAG